MTRFTVTSSRSIGNTLFRVAHAGVLSGVLFMGSDVYDNYSRAVESERAAAGIEQLIGNEHYADAAKLYFKKKELTF